MHNESQDSNVEYIVIISVIKQLKEWVRCPVYPIERRCILHLVYISIILIRLKIYWFIITCIRHQLNRWNKTYKGTQWLLWPFFQKKSHWVLLTHVCIMANLKKLFRKQIFTTPPSPSPHWNPLTTEWDKSKQVPETFSHKFNFSFSYFLHWVWE